MASSSRSTKSVAVAVVSTPFAFPLTCHPVSRNADSAAFPALEPLHWTETPIWGNGLHDRYCDRAQSALHSGHLLQRGPQDECAQRFRIRQGLPGQCARGRGGMTRMRTFGSVE